jgi:hypothetical protein
VVDCECCEGKGVRPKTDALLALVRDLARRAEGAEAGIRDALDMAGQVLTIDNRAGVEKVMRVLSLALPPSPDATDDRSTR